MERVLPGDNVLLVWKGQPELKALEEFVESAKKTSGKDAAVENMDMFQAREEYFEVVFVGAVTPQMRLSFDEWSKVLKSLKPSGTVVRSTTDSDAAAKQLKMSGFINVSEAKPITDGVEIIGQKPAFQVGATAQLKLKKKVWTVDDDDDIVNEDDLLDESDKQKPAKEDLKCATTGKKKACKNCTCGLAEELDKEARLKQAASEQPKSSCGSCYLGDAFRCASCPYRGLPAFKPGDKITLDSDILKADA